MRGGFKSITQEDWIHLSKMTDLMPLPGAGWSAEPCRVALAATLPERLKEAWEYDICPWSWEATGGSFL